MQPGQFSENAILSLARNGYRSDEIVLILKPFYGAFYPSSEYGDHLRRLDEITAEEPLHGELMREIVRWSSVRLLRPPTILKGGSRNYR